MAISNARRHRDEQRARSNLETLIQTSPVGVVVFDAMTGNVFSINREARRIVGDLHVPGSSLEQLLNTLTFRRADGREISLEEFSLAEALSTGETVRAEEIVIEVPDGRRVTTLVNATPILSDDGEIESFVVILQDMTPLEDLERLRAEFLGMVSHELRVPLTSIKGSTAAVLGAPFGLDPAEMLQFFRIVDNQADHMRDLIGDLFDLAHIETGTLTVVPQPSDVAVLVDRAKNTFLSGGGRNNIHVDLPLNLPPVMADRRRIAQVLDNLLSNASRHSQESTAVHVTAVQEGIYLVVSVTDDGGGRVGRAPALPVSEVLADRRRPVGERRRGVGPRPCHLQGDSGGSRGPDLGRERWAGPGRAVHLHHSGGRGDRDRSRSTSRTVPAGWDDSGRASLRWTMTLRRWDTSGTRSRKRATP